MSRAYSGDLRQRIVRAVAGGASPVAAAHQFSVSVRTVQRYLRRQRETGDVAPTQQRHGVLPALRAEHDAALAAQLAAHPDATLAEHCDRWAATTGVRVSASTMCRVLARLRWTVKKSRW